MLLAGHVGGIMTALVRRFLAATDLPIGRPTNLTWVLDERGLAEVPGLESMHLINDLEAIAPTVLYGFGSTIPGPPALVAT